MGETGRPNGASETEPTRLLPAHFNDGRVVASVYTLPVERARAAVPAPDLHPLELPGRRAFAVVCTFEYLDSTLGPYREFAVGVVVRPKAQSGALSSLDLFSTRPDTGAWILSMPVTSESARAYGVELFGFPKTECRIDVSSTSNVCSTAVWDGDKKVLVNRVPLSRGVRFPVPWLVTYTRKGESTLRTRIKSKWWVTLGKGGGAVLDLADPSHPLAQQLDHLRLSNSPIFVLHGTRFRAILTAGERI